MKKLLLILLCLPMIGFGQNVNITDANFKAYLVGEPLINTNGDTEIQVSEAAAFLGSINCSNLNISDLTGIEAFTALTSLYCDRNQLTTLDVSNNTALTRLVCYINQLNSLDVSNNTSLTVLKCFGNQITYLDLSQNIGLTELSCSNNFLTAFDLSQNTQLENLGCSDNKLITLDLSNNIYLEFFYCFNNELTSIDLRNGNNYNIDTSFVDFRNNTNLTCINVDDSSYATANWINIDPQHYFSNNCSATAIQEHTTNTQLLKVTDLLGRETKQTNQPLFYIYDDGTLEKRIVIE